MSDAPAPVVEVEGLSLGLTTGDPVVEDVSFTRRRRPDPGPGGRVRQRQDHHRAGPARLHAPRRRAARRQRQHQRPADPRPGHQQPPQPARQGRLLRAAGPRRRPQPVAAGGRRGDGRAARAPRRRRVARVGQGLAGAGRAGRRPAAAAALPPPAVGRPAAAGHDRDGLRLRPAGGGAGRAHHRARRDHPGPDPGRAGPPARRRRHGDGVRLPRPGGGGEDGRSDRRHVRRPRGGERPGRRGDRAAPPPLHAGAGVCHPRLPPAARAARHPRRVGRRGRVAERLRLRAPLPSRHRPLQRGAARAVGRDARPLGALHPLAGAGKRGRRAR